jgi:peptidoglycan-associated lipoprotein
MNKALAKSGTAIVMGIVLLANPGCITKGFKSKPEDQRGSRSLGTKQPTIAGEFSNGDTKLPNISGGSSSDETTLPTISGGSSDDETKLPPISGGSSSGELSGFSRNPSEERLDQDGYSAGRPPDGASPRQHAELTKEEKAAMKAGLQDVFFGFDQWTLSDAAMDALNHNAGYLKKHSAAVLKIEGHCDERGTADYNMILGEKRAEAARDYLVDVLVKPKQLDIVSYGKERPFCLDQDESCYQQNRRDHMLLTINDQGIP